MDDASLAASLARAAGGLAARMLREGLTVEHKTSVSDVVSAADHAAEHLVVSRLAVERPDDAIVGEEGSSRAGTSGRSWFVDPVDGTYNFLSGLPAWCSAVALDDVVGAVYQPETDELWLGGPSTLTSPSTPSTPSVPTSRNGEPLAALTDRPLASLSVATYLHPTTLPDPTLREPLLAVISQAATVRMLGSGSIELAAVAAGRLGASVQTDSLPWDWLPGAALVRGAGGVAEVVEVRAGAGTWPETGWPSTRSGQSCCARFVAPDRGSSGDPAAARPGPRPVSLASDFLVINSGLWRS